MRIRSFDPWASTRALRRAEVASIPATWRKARRCMLETSFTGVLVGTDATLGEQHGVIPACLARVKQRECLPLGHDGCKTCRGSFAHVPFRKTGSRFCGTHVSAAPGIRDRGPPSRTLADSRRPIGLGERYPSTEALRAHLPTHQLGLCEKLLLAALPEAPPEHCPPLQRVWRGWAVLPPECALPLSPMDDGAS